MNNRTCLAWYQWPEPEGTSYFEGDLADPQKVEEVFNYCQILLANITREGWRFLVKTHGFSGLLEINRKSGWFDDEDDAVAMEEIRSLCLISGYDPDTDQFGEYDAETGQLRLSCPWTRRD